MMKVPPRLSVPIKAILSQASMLALEARTRGVHNLHLPVTPRFNHSRETALIRFYFHPTPNPLKVALFLEESGIAYEVVPVDTRKGEQHAADFKAVNPNGKLPSRVRALSAKTSPSSRTWTKQRSARCSRRTIPSRRRRSFLTRGAEKLTPDPLLPA